MLNGLRKVLPSRSLSTLSMRDFRENLLYSGNSEKRTPNYQRYSRPFTLNGVIIIMCYTNFGAEIYYRTSSKADVLTVLPHEATIEEVLDILTKEDLYEVYVSNYDSKSPLLLRRWEEDFWNDYRISVNDSNVWAIENALCFLLGVSPIEIPNATHFKFLKLFCNGDIPRFLYTIIDTFYGVQYGLNFGLSTAVVVADNPHMQCHVSCYAKTSINQSRLLRLGFSDRRGYSFDLAYDLPLFYGESNVREVYPSDDQSKMYGIKEHYKVIEMPNVAISKALVPSQYYPSTEHSKSRLLSSYDILFSSQDCKISTQCKILSKCLSLLHYLESVGHAPNDELITKYKHFNECSNGDYKEMSYNRVLTINEKFSPTKENHLLNLELSRELLKVHSGGLIGAFLFVKSLEKNASVTKKRPNGHQQWMDNESDVMRLLCLYYVLQCKLSTSSAWCHHLDYTGKKAFRNYDWILTREALYYRVPSKYRVPTYKSPPPPPSHLSVALKETKPESSRALDDTLTGEMVSREAKRARLIDRNMKMVNEHDKDSFEKTKTDLERLMLKRQNKRIEKNESNNRFYTSGRFNVKSKTFGKEIPSNTLNDDEDDDDDDDENEKHKGWRHYSGRGRVPIDVSLDPFLILFKNSKGKNEDRLYVSKSHSIANMMDVCGKDVLLESDRITDRWPYIINPFVNELDENYREHLTEKYLNVPLTREEKSRIGPNIEEYDAFVKDHERRCLGSLEDYRKNTNCGAKHAMGAVKYYSLAMTFCACYEFIYAIQENTYDLEKMMKLYGKCAQPPSSSSSLEDGQFRSANDDICDAGDTLGGEDGCYFPSADWSDHETESSSPSDRRKKVRERKKKMYESYESKKHDIFSDVVCILLPFLDFDVCTRCAWMYLPCDPYNIHPLWVQTVCYSMAKWKCMNVLCFNPPNIPKKMEKIAYVLYQEGLNNFYRTMMLGYHDHEGHTIYDVFTCYWEFYEELREDSVCKTFHVWRTFDYYDNCLKPFFTKGDRAKMPGLNGRMDHVDSQCFEDVFLANAFFMALDHGF